MKKINIQSGEGSPQQINREIKTLRNWDWTSTPNATKERPITIGQYVEIGDVKGFVARYENGFVFVEDSIQQGKLVKIEMKKFLKSFKPSTKKKDIVANISIEGPSNASNGSIPKEDKGNIKKLNDISTKVKDQKISNKNNKISKVKKFTDMSKEFDSTKITSKKKDLSADLTKTSDNKDDSFLKISKVKTFSQLTTDLESTPEAGKTVKSKAKNLEANIDKKADTHETTITKVKSFSQLKSEFESKPKQGGKLSSTKEIKNELDGKANKKDTKFDKIFQVKSISDFLKK